MTSSNNPQSQPLAYPLRQWCKLVGVSPSSAYEKIRRGRLRVVKIGKRTLVPAAESARVMAEGI